MAAKPGTATHARHLRRLAGISLALATGRRIGGMRLRLDQVDLAARELRIEREKGYTGRVLPIAAWAVEVLAAYLKDGRPRDLCIGGAKSTAAPASASSSAPVPASESPWLFPGRNGGPVGSVQWGSDLHQLVTRTIAANPDLDALSRKRLSWHSLRVSFATMLFRGGCDIRSVNELLLHRCLSTTALYTPMQVDDLRRILRTAHPRP